MNYSHRFGWRRFATLRALLLGVPFVDEWVDGFLPIALPLLQRDLDLSYREAGLLFTAGAVAALVLDPIINLLSDRGGKRPWVLGGLLVLALGFALAASAQHFVVLLLAFTITPSAGGAAVGLAQAALIDAAPHDAPRTMTRWTLLSGVGDLLSPATVALVLALSLGWRPLFWFAALLWLIAAAALWRQRFPQPVAVTDDEDTPSLLGGLRAALRNPLLLRYAAIVLFTSMLDEVFLGFAGLYFQNALGATPVAISLVLGAQMVGALAALAILDRVVGRWRAVPLLATLALATLLGVAVLLSTRSVVLAAGALLVIGAGAAGWYPLATAEAYQLLPGRSGTVRAVIAFGAPFEAVLPWAVGDIADRFGITVGVAVLGLAPLLVLVCLPWRTR